MRLALWWLSMAARAWWTHNVRRRALVLSEIEVDRLVAILSRPGVGADPRFLALRDFAAAKVALMRVRLGADAETATASLWRRFWVSPSDLLGVGGPVRMMLLHEFGGYVTVLPWAMPAPIVAAFDHAARDRMRRFEAEFEEAE